MKTIALAVAGLLLGQAAPPRPFDVVSVKVHGDGRGTTRRDEPLGMTYLNITLGEFIRLAYGLRIYQIAGPDWATNNGSSTRFDVIARTTAPMTEQELHAALAPVLAERFHLVFHRETRTLPVYLLVVDKGGPKFKEGDGGESIASPDPATGAVRYANYPMAALAGLLSIIPTTGRPVLDRTGLNGKYTFTVNLFSTPPGLGPGDTKSAIGRSETPAFTALREQLGLRLEPDRAPIEMFVIDNVDKIPTAD